MFLSPQLLPDCGYNCHHAKGNMADGEEKYSQSSNSKKSHKNQDVGSSFFNGLVSHVVVPSDNAAYVMTFMMSFQYWLGGQFAN